MIMWYIPPNPDTQLPESLYHHFFAFSKIPPDFQYQNQKRVAEIVDSTESGEEQVKKKHFSKNHQKQVRRVGEISLCGIF